MYTNFVQNIDASHATKHGFSRSLLFSNKYIHIYTSTFQMAGTKYSNVEDTFLPTEPIILLCAKRREPPTTIVLQKVIFPGIFGGCNEMDFRDVVIQREM